MESAGLALGVVGIAAQLYTTSMQCYDVLSDAGNLTIDHDDIQWAIETEKNRLIKWENKWGISSGSGQQGLDPQDYRYRYAVGTLARIVVLFASIESLNERYGIQASSIISVSPGTSVQGQVSGGSGALKKRDRISAFLHLRPRKSKTSSNAVTTPGASTLGLISSLDPNGIRILQNPAMLENRNLVPGLQAEIDYIKETMTKLQQIIPTYDKLRWAVTDKKKFLELIAQLKRYNDGLSEVLPEPNALPAQPPAPSFEKFKVPVRLPVQRNKRFVGRGDFLDRLHIILDPLSQNTRERQVAILYGLGGMGKSQIVTEYAYRNSSSYTSIFWVDATNQATLAYSSLAMMEQLVSHYQTKWKDSTPDFAEIGDMLGLPGFIKSTGQIRDECPPELITRAVKKWLSSVGNDGWLVVFDNHDDIESVKMLDFFPTCNFGSVVVTTRRPEVKHLGVGMEVAEIDKGAGISILLASASKDPQITSGLDYDEASKIAEKLGYLPLALDQAGGYISAMQMQLSEYLPLYNTFFERVASASHPGISERYRSDTLLTTWKISFDSLPPAASNLLYLCSFLANGNKNIPKELFDRAKGNVSWFGKDNPFVHDGVKSLLSFSLAKRPNYNGEIGLSFHPLVLEWTRQSLDTASRQNFIMRSIALLAGSLQFWSNDLFKTELDWAYERRLSPHIDISFYHLRGLPDFSKLDAGAEAADAGAADAMAVIGNFLVKNLRYGEAEEMIKMSLKLHQQVAGSQDPIPHTMHGLCAVRSLGSIFLDKRLYGEALELYQQALPGLERLSGKDSPDALEAMGGMASVFSLQNRHQEALEMQEQVLAGYERVRGKEHPDTLYAICSMALLFHRQGKYAESLEWYERALAGQERVFGKSHPRTLETIKSVAVGIQYGSPGRLHDALEMYKSVLAAQEDLLGPQNPDTVDTVYKIATAYQQDGKYQEALDLYQKVLADQENFFGTEHTKTCSTISSIALCFQNQGKYQEAIDLHKQVLAVQERLLGEEHPDTLRTIRNISDSFQRQGKSEEALLWYGRVVYDQWKVLGEEHPDSLSTMYDVALLLGQQGRHQEALELWEIVIPRQEKALGQSHPEVLRSVGFMGTTIQELGRYDEAFELYERVLAGQEEVLGPQHPDTLRTNNNIAILKLKQGETEAALIILQQTLVVQEEVNGKEHGDNLITMYNIASCFHIQGRYQEAVDLYRIVLAGRTKFFGPDNPWTISTAIELSAAEGKLQE